MKPYVYLGGHRGLMITDNMRIIFDTRDIGMINLLSGDGIYEADVVYGMNSYLQPGSVFFDVGANVGIHSLRAARMLKGSGQIFAFEPNAHIHSLLCDNIKLRGGGITPVQAAVYDRRGTMDFSYEESQHRVGALKLPDAINYGEISYSVDVVTLDDYIDRIPHDAPVVIKADVEGREAGVMAGARKLLQRDRVTVIVEYQSPVMTSTGAKLEEYFQSFAALGFTAARLRSDGATPISYEELLLLQDHTNLLLTKG